MVTKDGITTWCPGSQLPKEAPRRKLILVWNGLPSSEPCDDKLPEYAAQLAISDALANLSFLIESSRKPLEQYSE